MGLTCFIGLLTIRRTYNRSMRLALHIQHNICTVAGVRSNVSSYTFPSPRLGRYGTNEVRKEYKQDRERRRNVNMVNRDKSRDMLHAHFVYWCDPTLANKL